MNQSDVYIVSKPPGWTPLQAIEVLVDKQPELRDRKLTYAGRLDPMAEGVLLILANAGPEERREYLSLEKNYTFEVLFGVETDTYDLLGLVTSGYASPPSPKHLGLVEKDQLYAGDICQPYPPYSSKVVNGKPLWLLAKEGKLPNTLPLHEVSIYNFSFVKKEVVSSDELFKKVVARVSEVSGDFRQREIIDTWRDFLSIYSDLAFPLCTFSVQCSSGTYVRQIALEMGRMLKCGGLAYSIQRSSVGDFTLDQAMSLV